MENKSTNMSLKEREKAIVRTSFIGIIVNIVLAGTKALIGLISNSIAIVLDAVNNLADALSSVITIVGAKLGAKKPNKKHPLGYGRVEYISSMLVAALVIYAGITSLVESIKKIVSPEAVEYSTVSLIILLIAVVVKMILGIYVKKQGKKYTSVALVASGTEAMMDGILSIAVVISAIIYLIWGISLEAYIGAIIAIMIVKAGIEMMLETLNDIIGKRNDKEVVTHVKKVICEEPEVQGAYDLFMFNYGPNKNYASVHIEVPDTMTVDKLDTLSRRIQENVLNKCGVALTGIGIYSHNTSDNEASKIRDDIKKIALKNEWALQMHGFYIDIENKKIRFDLVISFLIDSDKAIEVVKNDIQKQYSDYQVDIACDIDV